MSASQGRQAGRAVHRRAGKKAGALHELGFTVPWGACRVFMLGWHAIGRQCRVWLCGSVQGQTLKQHIDITLGQGNIKEAVLLPPGEDLNEWLAVNTVDFYNAISVLYGTLQEFCTARSCPVMSAGPKVRPLYCRFGRYELYCMSVEF